VIKEHKRFQHVESSVALKLQALADGKQVTVKQQQPG
jgi:hypothetical protein